MQLWTILFSRLLVTLLPIMLMDLGGAEATQKARKTAVKQESSPIIGESDESDTVPVEGSDDEAAVDEGEATPLKPKESSKTKNKNSKNKEKSEKEKAKDRKAAQKRKKLIEGFSKAEEFHKAWYHLPATKIKTSLEKLTNFCKVACTKKQCMDEEVANHCHLICPQSTTKQCADPLKQAGNEDAEEVRQGDEDVSPDAMASAGPASEVSPSPMSSSIEQGDAAIMDRDGEGG